MIIGKATEDKHAETLRSFGRINVFILPKGLLSSSISFFIRKNRDDWVQMMHLAPIKGMLPRLENNYRHRGRISMIYVYFFIALGSNVQHVWLAKIFRCREWVFRGRDSYSLLGNLLCLREGVRMVLAKWGEDGRCNWFHGSTEREGLCSILHPDELFDFVDALTQTLGLSYMLSSNLVATNDKMLELIEV